MNLQELFSLEGRIALVTGGSRGIGKMFVEGLLAAGCARVYISARKVEQMQETIAEFGEDKVIGIPADLSQMDGIQTLADEMAAREDRLDILINNAGAAWGQPYLEFNEAGWHRTMDLNVKTPFFLTQKLLPLLRKAATYEEPARIINTASINGIEPPILETYAYSSSKAGMIMLTRHLAGRLASDNILVNAIAPGPFPSNMMAATLATMGDAIKADNPRKRIGEPEDIAGVAIFLASRASAYTTGACVPCDGGASQV